ncbi:sigma-70 family RNA polymerase sigma factor [Streptomyces sp. NPDC051098]|uniref:sigma-70 family RNA polymerase sigma factor n=1 Tax=Streptomyces sp. NPDC051098 TaxID=3155411 RepID=UPI003438FCDF
MAEPEMETDTALTRARNAEAVRVLVVEQYGQMVGYARKHLRIRGVPQTSADPEDVVQESLKLVLARTQPIDFIRSYVYEVMKNEIKRVAERHFNGQGYASLDADVQREDEPAVHPVADIELRQVIDDAMSALPLQQRRAVLLTKEMGLTQAEAAQVLATAAPTVGVHVHRAVRALRVSLVGAGLTLITWVAGDLVRVRKVSPAAGVQLPGGFTAPMSAVITLAVVLLGTAILLPVGANFRSSGSWLREMGLRMATGLVGRRLPGAGDDPPGAQVPTNNSPPRDME